MKTYHVQGIFTTSPLPLLQWRAIVSAPNETQLVKPIDTQFGSYMRIWKIRTDCKKQAYLKISIKFLPEKWGIENEILNFHMEKPDKLQYRLSKSEKIEIAQNIVNILSEGEALKKNTRDYIVEWVIGKKIHLKAFSDVWEYVLQVVYPLFIICSQILF